MEEKCAKLFSQEGVVLGDEESTIIKKIFMTEEDNMNHIWYLVARSTYNGNSPEKKKNSKP